MDGLTRESVLPVAVKPGSGGSGGRTGESGGGGGAGGVGGGDEGLGVAGGAEAPGGGGLLDLLLEGGLWGGLLLPVVPGQSFVNAGVFGVLLL